MDLILDKNKILHFIKTFCLKNFENIGSKQKKNHARKPNLIQHNVSMVSYYIFIRIC